MKADYLIKQIASGNRKALEKLYKGYYRLVSAVVYSITRNVADTEDVTAEVFVTVWKKAEGYYSGGGKAWLCSIAKNHALNFIKKRDRENITLSKVEDYVFCSVDNDIDKKLEIERALEILSNEERETVLLYNAGLKHHEIASITKTALGTITWRYNNALKKMREFLKEGKNEK